MTARFWKIALTLTLLLLLLPACRKPAQEPESAAPAEDVFPIRADYAGDNLPDHFTFVADEGEYAAEVLFTTEVPVEHFTFFELVFDEMDGDDPFFSTHELYEIPIFEPGKPLLVRMTFGEVFPAYGFTFKNAEGYFKTYGVSQSGMDGSVVISPVKAALG